MKTIFAFASTILLLSCAAAKERTYTGSTPAGREARLFLGISPKDSVDFIRWNVRFANKHFKLVCNYGIGKPNSNSFINGGSQVSFEGRFSERNDTLYLHSRDRKIAMYRINDNLLHLLDSADSLLVGNDGWSYTLSAEEPVNDRRLNLRPQPLMYHDSATFTGRTPCPPSLIPLATGCYKLKWDLTLFSHRDTDEPVSYRLRGTVTNHEWITGECRSMRQKDGLLVYHISFGDKKFYFIPLDQKLIIFTDSLGKPFTGNADFSFTLNRRAN